MKTENYFFYSQILMESVDAFTVQTYVVTSTHIKAETLTVKPHWLLKSLFI